MTACIRLTGNLQPSSSMWDSTASSSCKPFFASDAACK